MHKKGRVEEEEEQVLHTKIAKTNLVRKENVVDGREKKEKETQREEGREAEHRARCAAPLGNRGECRHF